MLTPLEITTLLAVYCYPDRSVSPTGIGRLSSKTLIEPIAGISIRLDREPGCAGTWRITSSVTSAPFTANCFTLTSRGKAMVRALTNLPLPQPYTEIKTDWIIPGTDFEFAESEL